MLQSAIYQDTVLSQRSSYLINEAKRNILNGKKWIEMPVLFSIVDKQIKSMETRAGRHLCSLHLGLPSITFLLFIQIQLAYFSGCFVGNE